MKTIYVTVGIEVDDDVYVSDAKEYVEGATKCMGGAFEPDNPFFGDNKRVTFCKAGLANPYGPKKIVQRK